MTISAKLFNMREGTCSYQSVKSKVFEILHKAIQNKSELDLYAFENYFILLCCNIFFMYFENKE